MCHILEAIERIEKYVLAGEEAFRKDELVQIWVLYHLQIIGEAARALPEAFRERYPEIPWQPIIGMRHFLVHEYSGIDLDIVWRTAARELPGLKGQVQSLLEEGDTET